MADKGNRGSLAVMAGVVVLLHLAGFWALDGLPPQFPLGVFVVAYLLGMRWAFEPGNTAAVDRAGDRIAGLGRSATMAAFWFALGFATTVYVLAVLFTIGLQMLAWRDRPVILDGSFTGVFLGIFGILQFVALIGAVRMRRDGSSPPVRLEGFLGRVSSAWQLFPVGLLLGFGLFLAVEVGLLVLAAGQLALVAPMYLTWVLPMVFAAGMSLGATLQGAAGARIDGRLPVLNIAFTAAAAVVALIASAVRVLGPVPDGFLGRLLGFLGDVFVALFRLLRRLLNYLLDRPGLLLLLLIVLVVVVALRRRKTDSGSGAAPAKPARTAASPGPAKPGRADRVRTALRDRKEAGARKKAVREQERQAREREKAAQRARQEAAARSAAAPRPAVAPATQRSAPAPATYARGRATTADRPQPARATARPAQAAPPPVVAAAPPVRAAAAPRPARATATPPAQPVAAAAVSPVVQPVVVQPVAAAPVSPAVQPVVYGRPVVVTDPDYTETIVAESLPGGQTGIAIVTGAGAGLGRAIALGLAGAGYGILAADLDADSAAACATQARGYGVPAQAVRPDVRQPGYLERIVAVADEWGGPVVLVNAGAGGWPSPVTGRTAEMHLTDLTRESMRIRGGGAILNVVPSASADTPALVRFTADRSADRDGVRIMCLTTDQPFTTPDEAVTAVLDLIRHGRAGTVVALQSWNPTPGTVPLP